MTIREAIRLTLREGLERDDDVFVMGEDIGKFGSIYRVTGDLVEQFDEIRVRDTPISETDFIGVTTDAAVTRTRPVIETMFSGLIGVYSKQIANRTARSHCMFGGKAEVPVIVRATKDSRNGAAS